MRYIPTSKLFQGTAIFVVMLGAVLAPQIRHAVADGKPGDETKGNPTTRQYNDRLPPILPGEQVVTETGQKMHVWSSSGPVPVNPLPTPQQLPSGLGGAGVGVIVDGRADRDHRGVGDGVDSARNRPR